MLETVSEWMMLSAEEGDCASAFLVINQDVDRMNKRNSTIGCF